MGWTHDDESFYMLVGDKIEYHGPNQNLPPINTVINNGTFFVIGCI